jgi:hypothetical protein
MLSLEALLLYCRARPLVARLLFSRPLVPLALGLRVLALLGAVLGRERMIVTMRIMTGTTMTRGMIEVVKINQMNHLGL